MINTTAHGDIRTLGRLALQSDMLQTDHCDTALSLYSSENVLIIVSVMMMTFCSSSAGLH